MSTFECNQLSDSTVMVVYLERDRILLSPTYQREGEVWTLYKKQLLIDSLINGYDIPKIYLHEYEKAKKQGGHLIKYAIVDGKQRLSAIWQFMDGQFPLDGDFEYLRDPKIKLGGLCYEDLRREHTAIHARFTGRPLSIITIKTSDMDLIEDMFLRLNEAVPLNAAEKRNAFGGPLPITIRKLVKEKFFTECLSIPSTRDRHHDLACKLLYLESQDRPAETKKATLDLFVFEYARNQFKQQATELLRAVRATLRAMKEVFKPADPLLKSPGTVVVYFLLFRGLAANVKVRRSVFERFEKALDNNRTLAEEHLGRADWELLEYDRLTQTPNDSFAIEFRLKTLRKHTLGVKDAQIRTAPTAKRKTDSSPD